MHLSSSFVVFHVCPSTWEGHVCLLCLSCVSVQLLAELFTHLHAVVSVHAQFMTLLHGSRFQGCVVRIKRRPLPYHACLHMSAPHLQHSHLLPRSLHQEQPLRSHCLSINTALLRQKRSLALWPKLPLPQVMSPISLTISTSQRLLKSSCRSNPATQMPSYLHDAELSDETIGKALSSPLFIQEREEPASRRQAYHSFEESLLPSQSLSVCYVRTGRPVHELSSLGSSIREKPSGEMEELQKIHVLKVEELSRRKSTEDFEEVTSIFQGSNVKTVYIFVTTTRSEVPRCWDWRRAHQEFAGFTTVPSGARSKCEPVASLSLSKRKLVSTCTVNFQ